jgi:hypothetical protein
MCAKTAIGILADRPFKAAAIQANWFSPKVPSQREQGSCPAIGHAFQGVATR